MVVTKDTIISEVMEGAPQTYVLFKAIGMHCMGCAMANGETVAEACEVHGVDAEEFIKSLNAFIEKI